MSAVADVAARLHGSSCFVSAFGDACSVKFVFEVRQSDLLAPDCKARLFDSFRLTVARAHELFPPSPAATSQNETYNITDTSLGERYLAMRLSHGFS